MKMYANGTLGAGACKVNNHFTFIDLHGKLHVEDMNCQAINTSKIRMAYQSHEDSIMFITNSGSHYELFLESRHDLISSFSQALLEEVDGGNEALLPLKYSQIVASMRANIS